MTSPQIRSGRWQRFFGWFGRHKVTAVFCVLVLALGLYLFGSWVVLQVEIRGERGRFEATHGQLASVTSDIERNLGKPAKNATDEHCTYSSFGLFTAKSLSCSTIRYLMYPRDNLTEATQLVKSVNNAIEHSYPIHKERGTTSNAANIATYDLNLGTKDMSCFIDYWFRDDSGGQVALGGVYVGSNSVLVEVACSSSAKAEYFPVVKS